MRQERGKDADRQTEVKDDTDGSTAQKKKEKRRFTIRPRPAPLPPILHPLSSLSPSSPSLHFVVRLMLFQHLRASASHPPKHERASSAAAAA